MFASQASWVCKGEIFLACNPGSWKEGGAQKLNEDETGGWRCQIPGSCKRGGPKGLVCPGPRVRGSFFRGGSGALRRIDEPRSKRELKVGRHCPGLGWGGDRDARVPPCWQGSLTALCSRPRRGLALGCRWAGPRGGRGGSATGSCPRCYCWVSSRPTTEKALRPSPRVEDSRVAKGGVRRDAGALCTRLRALRRWEGLGGGHLDAVCSAEVGGVWLGWEGCGACMPTFVPCKGGRHRPSLSLCALLRGGGVSMSPASGCGRSQDMVFVGGSPGTTPGSIHTPP